MKSRNVQNPILFTKFVSKSPVAIARLIGRLVLLSDKLGFRLRSSNNPIPALDFAHQFVFSLFEEANPSLAVIASGIRKGGVSTDVFRKQQGRIGVIY